MSAAVAMPRPVPPAALLHPDIAMLIAHLRAGPLTRFVAFGSSNTERAAHAEGAHTWFDWFDVGLQAAYGRVHHTINAGICGENTRHLLARFDRDVAFYQPQAIFITIGGNDSNPNVAMPEAEFQANLLGLVGRVRALPGSVPVLQTYYSFDLDKIDPVHGARFLRFMQIVRDTATATGAALVDNLARWEVLRQRDLAAYRALMRDPMHVKPLGNALWGLDLCRVFAAPLRPDVVLQAQPGLDLQQRLDGMC